MCLCASEEREDEERKVTKFVVHEEEREKRCKPEINKIINTHAMHGYCSNCVFIHKFTLTDVGDFLLKLCKSSYFFHFTHLCPS